jgi:hypothetical protein
MTIHAPVRSTDQDGLWDNAAVAANAWRGHAIQIFAQAELAVSETLEALAAVPGRGAGVRMRRLVGQRFQDLQDALSGPFDGEAGKAADALATFRQHEDLRPLLCHGASKLALDRHGRWMIVLKLVTFRGRDTERLSRTFEQQDAEDLLMNIREDGRRLSSSLQSLRSRLSRGDC